MDVIQQNKFKNQLIIVLLAINLITVSVLWMQVFKKDAPMQKAPESRPGESVNLMKQALDLNDGQTKQFEKMQADQLEQSKKYNDHLTELKKQLADELFHKNPDTTLVNSKAKEIGELQSKVEVVRFKQFNKLMAILTPEQKEKLKPVLSDLFGRKPPREDVKDNRIPEERRRENNADDKSMKEVEGGVEKKQQDDKPAPPTIDERLAKYTKRLNLSGEQVQQVRVIFAESKQKNEQLRMKQHPDPNEVTVEKEKTRKNEDDAIMKILSEEQKTEFLKMLMKRRN